MPLFMNIKMLLSTYRNERTTVNAPVNLDSYGCGSVFGLLVSVDSYFKVSEYSFGSILVAFSSETKR